MRMIPREGRSTSLTEMDPATLTLLKEHLPDFVPIIHQQSFGWKRIALPLAEGADYRFSVHEDANCDERQISASLANEASKDKYFWYMPLEFPDFHNSAEELAKCYLGTLLHLLTRQTRIIQTKGLLNWSFRCESLNGQNWEHVYGHLGLRISCKAPRIKGRKRVYTSPPLSTKTI